MKNLKIAETLITAAFCCLGLTVVVPAQQPEANYDEAKVGRYTLPDPLITNSGKRVTDKRDWRQRRSEILQLFETHVYGRIPKTSTRINWEVTSTDAGALKGLATRREMTVFLTGAKDGPRMNLLLYVPNKRTGPVPVFLGMNFVGNHGISSDPSITLPIVWLRESRDGAYVSRRATEDSRGSASRRWPLEKIVSRGYAVMTLYYGDIFPDHKDGWKNSIIPAVSPKGNAAPAPDDWNAIGAWSWGLSRAMDYIEKDNALNAKRVALLGHSRLGKTSLWAGAVDERFAIVIANESGEGGAALSRRNFGETVERINTSFPHWFCGNYKKYNRDVASLPVDQHMLIALIAPRPVYIASAAEDLWADPRGEYLSALAADPVYRLLGTDGLAKSEMPGLHQPITSTIGYHIRAGKHDVTDYDWEQFMNFTDRHFK
ncbi:MAG: acetylxylan esterase [Acidobacteria bacterium]|nr:acetylxylan esterase [Acidobacteriota bacterium]